jgi:hypothetical protein
MLSSRFRSSSKKSSARDAFSRLKRPMRSPRYGRDEENSRDIKRLGAKEQGWSQDGFSEQAWAFLRDRLSPDDLEELAQMLQGGDEDLGGMVEEDEEPSPPFYGKYGENVKGPLDFSSKEKRNQGYFQGARDSRLRTPSARAVDAYNTRFPDAERIG